MTPRRPRARSDRKAARFPSQTEGALAAGKLLELAGALALGDGYAAAQAMLSDGRAWRKFQAICQAQGGMREPPRPAPARPIEAGRGGRVVRIDNRRLARIAKLVGAPRAPAAGLDLHVCGGDAVAPGQPIFTLQAEAPGELAYALAYAEVNPDVVLIGGEPLCREGAAQCAPLP